MEDSCDNSRPYADDAALFTNSKDGGQKVLEGLSIEGEKLNMEISI